MVGEQQGLFGNEAKVTKCYYCDKPSQYLCDFVATIIPSTAFVDPTKPYRTCDRPVCADHYLVVANFFLCGKNPSRDSLGLCEEHKQFEHFNPFQPNRYGSEGWYKRVQVYGEAKAQIVSKEEHS